MSVMIDIRGVPVQFPFQPYDIQKDYMEKVIECIEKETVAVLESPTGTGKTLSLLCSTLAWLQLKKSKIQAQRQLNMQVLEKGSNEPANDLTGLYREFLGVPTIIYASRTHSQLSQAVQEMKKTAYGHMHASVLGSRDQLCIHPEVLAEQDRSARLHMCRLKVAARACHYKNRVDTMKESPELCNTPILDIEDMVKMGNKQIFCPYFMTKERQQKADIIFTPYNYLLDPVVRKSLGLKLANSVIILDEGHNVESVCEEAASIDVKSSDLALAIDETTQVMKMISEMPSLFEASPKGDIDPDSLANLKLMLIEFEKALDDVALNASGDQVNHFPGDFIFEMLEKAQITLGNCVGIASLIDDIIQYLTAQNEGPFARKGKGLQLFSDFLTIVFHSKASRDKIKHCYKVHIKDEEQRQFGRSQMKTWLDKGSTKAKNRILSFWCFSPGFGMEFIVSQGIKGLILTSGTLAPLKPLISELELDVKVTLENPHIVKENQICVKILPKGPDGEPLNSSFRNRDNPKYITSLGRAIVNLSRIVPDGLLIFFPSYPIMNKCQSTWEAEGIWADIASKKAIFVEPKGKDAFNTAMTGYYEKIRDPNMKGAVFMAVCRGKVSEGLDFIDANGRAVIITGLPYPPLKDPRVILKRRYLDSCHAQNKEYLTGQDWYSLEASRAVNQAVGRVIRHRYDYGAILLLDERFNGFGIKEQMSKWLRGHIKVVTKYGDVIKDLSQFFRKAQSELPTPELKPLVPPKASFDTSKRRGGNFDFGATSSSFSGLPDQTSGSNEMINKYLGTNASPNGTVTIHEVKRRNDESLANVAKKRKFHLSNSSKRLDQINKEGVQEYNVKTTMKEYILMLKKNLGANFTEFSRQLKLYRETKNIGPFINAIDPLVPKHTRHVLIGLDPYIAGNNRAVYRDFLRKNSLPIPEDL